MYNYYLTLEQASRYSEIPVKSWLKWIAQGLVTADSEILSEAPDSDKAKLIRISLSSLPRHASQRYIRENLLASSYFSLDLIGFRTRHGQEVYLQLLGVIEELKEASEIRYTARLTTYADLKCLAKKHHQNVRTLYKYEDTFMSNIITKLGQPNPKTYKSRQLCQLSESFIAYRFSQPNAGSQNEILNDLRSTAAKLGKTACNRCPYNQESKSHQRLKTRFPDAVIKCRTVGSGMIVPESRYPVNRFLASLPDQEICYGRQGYNAWADRFMHKTIRTKPPSVNEVWYGDHHLCDVIVIIGKDMKTGAPILGRPWVTACSDAASDALVGSVVTLRPNKQTIAECFCRAAAFTLDSPFYGLCEVFYVDRGKDYKATLVEGRDYAMRSRIDQELHLNRAFCDNPLLPALNVTVHHALPRAGRSKTIERIFGTIERKWIRKLPGWTGNCREERPFDFYREQKNLIRHGKLMTIEEFARYWFDIIIPGYNGYSATPEKMPPINRYRNAPRANTIIPDWNTLSVFMVEKPRHKIHCQGIKYRGEFYWHPDLRDHVNEYALIFDFDQSFCHSISVIIDGHYLCEAEPIVHHSVMERDRLKLARHIEEQKIQRRRISHHVACIKQSIKLSGIQSHRYTEYEPDDEPQTQESLTAYGEAIDFDRDKAEASILSDTANELVKVASATQEAVNRIVQGPEEAPLTDFFRKLAGSELRRSDDQDKIQEDGQQ